MPQEALGGVLLVPLFPNRGIQSAFEYISSSPVQYIDSSPIFQI